MVVTMKITRPVEWGSGGGLAIGHYLSGACHDLGPTRQSAAGPKRGAVLAVHFVSFVGRVGGNSMIAMFFTIIYINSTF